MNESKRQIDIKKMFLSFYRDSWIIILTAVIFSIIGFFYTKYYITPIYRANALMLVDSKQDISNIYTSESFNSSQKLASTYRIVITSRSVLQPVIDDMGLDMTYEQLSSSISVSLVDATQVLSISVANSNRDTAVAITNKILEICPDIIIETVGAGSVKIVEYASASFSPVSPSIMQNTATAAVIGIVLACVIIIAIQLMDNTYKSEMDITSDFDYPVLGIIPSVESCTKYMNYGRRRKSKKNTSNGARRK